MPLYRKKPVIIEAVMWNGGNLHEILAMESTRPCYQNGQHLFINTLEGEMEAVLGDFIIKGVEGEIYPCKPDIFEKTYEKVFVYSYEQ